tara:strand:- start:1735 stop:2502 length:768 start_codon:yes stop_codon:yes gene_type:complete
MGTSKAVMVVVTHPKHPLVEAEYNDWYSNNHLQYVLLSPDLPSASRFKQTRVIKGSMTPYLALYQVEWDDVRAAQEGYASLAKKGIGAEWNRPPGNALEVDWWSYYDKIAEAGDPSPDQDPPNAILVTFSQPDGGLGKTSIFLSEQFESWHADHLKDMNDCPLVRGSTLYRIGLQAGGAPPPGYITVHELNSEASLSADQIHESLMDWMRQAELRADPAAMIEPNAPVGLLYWGYYDRITTSLKATEEELLSGRD